MRLRDVVVLLLHLSSVAGATLTASAKAAPIWLTRPACQSEEALVRRAPLLLPPRRVQETHLDSAGKSTIGRCLPFAILLQMQRANIPNVPHASDLKAIQLFRDDVLSFACQHHTAAWNSDGCSTLGDVIGKVAASRGWSNSLLPNGAAVNIWAQRLRGAGPPEGCDAAFLFAAAACHGLRIHVHYDEASRGMQDTRFYVPASADEAVLRPPRADVHVGFVDSGDGLNHYVSLPPLLW